ncbi:MAG TPA: hypothetical protein VF196_01055 [Casimicrobiaceae bacterium]
MSRTFLPFRLPVLRTLLAACGFVVLVVAPARAEVTAPAVEYYHAGFDHYFVTAYPHEIAALDGGAFGGAWSRTGLSFQVWSEPASGTSGACRFFSAAFAPKSSHFYTSVADECDLRKADPVWTFEAVAFRLRTAPTGTCEAGTLPLYRLYNAGRGSAPNHRYTTSRAIVDDMRRQGWVSEGSGPDVVFACVPLVGASSTTAEGVWRGTTSLGQNVLGFFLDDGSYYFVYSRPGITNSIVGFVQGTGTSSAGQFITSSARDYNFVGAGVSGATLVGSYVPKFTFAGTTVTSQGQATFSTTYVASYEQEARLSTIAGSYRGQVAGTRAIRDIVVTVGQDGTITGTAGLCTLNGTAQPRGGVNVFTLSVTFTGTGCPLGPGRLNGIAYFDTAEQGLVGLAPDAGRTDGMMLLVYR